METLPKVLESTKLIRFQDCDPFNHLNNAKYFDYLINAREDQLIANYDLNIYDTVKTHGVSWVVGTHQIAYLRPANLMETVTIDSQLLHYGSKSLNVEIRMWNETKTELKAVLWSSFIHYNVLKGKVHEHSETFMTLFKNVCLPIEATSFEQRIKQLRTTNF